MNLPIGRLALATATLCSIALTGCTLSANPAPPNVSALGTIQGRVFGGQQPISSASIYVYAAGTGGYGGASTLLSASPATTTDSNGNFSVTGDYTCTQGQQVYLYALGGNTGSGINSGAGLLALLGTCPASGTMAAVTPTVVINEVSTVAAAYAVAGFATDAIHISDDEGVGSNTFASLAKTGMANAFGNAANLVNLPSGIAYTTTGSITIGTTVTPNVIPQAQIYTIADILAACVNTISSSSTLSSACSTLFSTATSDGTATGVNPTDTATAAINIAHHPAANVATLYSLIAGTPVFAPDDAAAPSDFTISILYPQGGTGTVGLAVDGLGNAYGTYGSGGICYRITPAGVETALTTASQPRRLAIDASNNVWIPSDSSTTGVAGTIDMFAPGATSPTAYSVTNTAGTPVADITSLAFDPSGYLWALGAGTFKQVVLLNVGPSTAPAASATPLTYVTTPTLASAIAVDTAGNLGVTGGTTTTSYFGVTNSSVTAGTALTSTATGEVDGLYTPESVTPDASGDFWITNSAATGGDATVSEFNGSGSPVSTTGYSVAPLNGGSNTELFSGEFDGLGNFYTGGNTYASGTTTPNIAGIYVFNSSGAQTAVYVPPTTSNEFFAVDPSGNLWFGGNKTIGEMIGGAAPKITPVVTAINSGRTVAQTWRP